MLTSSSPETHLDQAMYRRARQHVLAARIDAAQERRSQARATCSGRSGSGVAFLP